ncbi:MAG: DUF1800 domain-containing protein [Bryobacterales bacterium]|nr:DUF1800 domain-containing protein [Bryobacterales bacterium]MBV9401443.1 DUF1800 domain-containing protein [Bryobacterales bacterium]
MRSLLVPFVMAMAAHACMAQSMSARAAARFLDQSSWGPTPSSIAELQSRGIDNWLAEQFAMNTSDLPDQEILTSAGISNNNLAPVQAAFFQNAVSEPDQLRQRVAFILSQIWVVSATSGVSPAYAYPPYWRIFRDNAFGNYRDVIKAVTLSPAMGRYLNMANNNKGNASLGTSPNENYARELMQLFTLGLTQLHLDGTPVLDANNNPIPTYDQSVVTNMARLLTGWTYPTAPGTAAKNNNPAYYFGQMFAVNADHDTTSKTIVGNVKVSASQSAEQDLESLLDALMAQPTMAPFISQQLIQHLVTSNPSPAYIQRVAQVFQDDGTGTAGNLQAVITAILTDPEARAGDASASAITPTFGHLREPILFMANVLRGLSATVAATNSVAGTASNLGENLFYAPSVFSYFSPQSRTAKGLYGPEFQIYSTQTAALRANAVNTLIYGTLGGVKLDLSPFTALAGNSSQLLDYIAQVFLHGSMSTQLESAAMSAMNAVSAPVTKAQAALYIVLTSSEYQIVQ